PQRTPTARRQAASPAGANLPAISSLNRCTNWCAWRGLGSRRPHPEWSGSRSPWPASSVSAPKLAPWEKRRPQPARPARAQRKSHAPRPGTPMIKWAGPLGQVSTTRVKANTRADFEAELRTGSPFGAANFSSDKGWLELAGNGRQFAGARIGKSEDPEVLRVKRKGRGSLLCRRVEFDAGTAGVSQSEQLVCFLPWLLSYGNCRKARLLPPNLLAAYEMPHGIVSSSPETCVAALQVVVDDFLELMLERSLQPAKLTLLGLSIGNFAATYIANMIGARLWAVAPGDRGEVLLWNSSIARGLRS